MPAEKLVQAFYDGKIISFVRKDTRSPSAFGGPIEQKPTGISYGPRPLHMIADVALWHLGIPTRPYLSALPLIYGLSFSGCSIYYKVSGSQIEILGLDPKESAEDFPYDNYPLMLP